jgi:hypothetical protein
MLLCDNSTRHDRVDSTQIEIPVLMHSSSVHLESLQSMDATEDCSYETAEMDWEMDAGATPDAESLAQVPEATRPHALIRLQLASGAWPDLGEVCKLIGKAADAEQWKNERAAATALAIEYLKSQGGGTYDGIIAKGVEWLDREVGKSQSAEMLKWAAQI